MKTVFIINPAAGTQNAATWLTPQIKQAAAAARQEILIEQTQYAGHARALAERYAAAGEPVRLYACGGDGTLNEILQAAVSCPSLAVGCVPCGSGNDYVRNFGQREDFLDIAAQLAAKTVRLDAIGTNYGYGIAICAAGLDAKVAYGIPKFRRLPGCGGTMAYTLSILQTVFSRFGHRLALTLDGREQTDTYMMAAFCNGQLYGGGYKAAPYARMDDGLLDILLVKPIPRVKIPGFLAQYKVGAHLTPEGTVQAKFSPYMQFCRAKEVSIKVLDGRPIIITVDGECRPTTELNIKIMPGGILALLPPRLLQHTPVLDGQTAQTEQ